MLLREVQNNAMIRFGELRHSASTSLGYHEDKGTVTLGVAVKVVSPVRRASADATNLRHALTQIAGEKC